MSDKTAYATKRDRRPAWRAHEPISHIMSMLRAHAKARQRNDCIRATNYIALSTPHAHLRSVRNYVNTNTVYSPHHVDDEYAIPWIKEVGPPLVHKKRVRVISSSGQARKLMRRRAVVASFSKQRYGLQRGGAKFNDQYRKMKLPPRERRKWNIHSKI